MIQRYRPQRMSYASSLYAAELVPDDNGEYVKFSDIPLQPVHNHSITSVLQIVGNALSSLGVSHNHKSIVDLVEHGLKSQPVPEPFPWLNKPDGEGPWFYEPEYDHTQWNVYRLFECEKCGFYYVGSGGRYHVAGMPKGRWQRIPQTTLPGEGGNDANSAT